ncbi:hypothetical protein [Amnibacterium sp.]|nr:hypothetical protein [Amnibacterium sp.]MCU1473567.1 hypothetical protein [Amnibacterium sp.]
MLLSLIVFAGMLIIAVSMVVAKARSRRRGRSDDDRRGRSQQD